MSSTKKTAPAGLFATVAYHAKPPIMFVRFKLVSGIEYFCHVLPNVVIVYRGGNLGVESGKGLPNSGSPVLGSRPTPPIKNSIFSPPCSPRAQKLSATVPLKLSPVKFVTGIDVPSTVVPPKYGSGERSTRMPFMK